MVTKIDTVKPDQLAPHLVAVAALADANGFEWSEVVPVSARTGEQVELFADLLIASAPGG